MSLGQPVILKIFKMNTYEVKIKGTVSGTARFSATNMDKALSHAQDIVRKYPLWLYPGKAEIEVKLLGEEGRDTEVRTVLVAVQPDIETVVNESYLSCTRDHENKLAIISYSPGAKLHEHKAVYEYVGISWRFQRDIEGNLREALRIEYAEDERRMLSCLYLSGGYEDYHLCVRIPEGVCTAEHARWCTTRMRQIEELVNYEYPGATLTFVVESMGNATDSDLYVSGPYSAEREEIENALKDKVSFRPQHA